MGRRGEVPAHDLGEEAGGNPDRGVPARRSRMGRADAGLSGGDGAARVGGSPLLDLGADLSALGLQGLQLRAPARCCLRG